MFRRKGKKVEDRTVKEYYRDKIQDYYDKKDGKPSSFKEKKIGFWDTILGTYDPPGPLM